MTASAFCKWGLPPAIVVLLTICGCSHDSASEPSPTIPYATYDATTPLCASTSAPPIYPAAAYKAALFDFAELTAHTLTIDSVEAVEAFTDADCTLSVTRTIHTNTAATFILRQDRRFTFTPEGCALSIVHDGIASIAAAGYSDLFVDSTARAKEIPYDVTVNDDASFTLTSADLPDLDALWAVYGCAPSDRIQITLNPQAKS